MSNTTPVLWKAKETVAKLEQELIIRHKILEANKIKYLYPLFPHKAQTDQSIKTFQYSIDFLHTELRFTMYLMEKNNINYLQEENKLLDKPKGNKKTITFRRNKLL